MTMQMHDLAARGDLDVPVVVIAGRRDDVAAYYSFFEDRATVSKNRTLATWYDGQYMIIIAGDHTLSRNVLIRLRSYLADYLYRKSER